MELNKMNEEESIIIDLALITEAKTITFFKSKNWLHKTDYFKFVKEAKEELKNPLCISPLERCYLAKISYPQSIHLGICNIPTGSYNDSKINKKTKQMEKYKGVKGLISKKIQALINSGKDDKDILFKLAGFYGEILQEKEVKNLYKHQN